MHRSICIIDDDLVSQFATRYCIQQYEENFDISTCTSAEEGLVVLSSLILEEKDFPDIIFLDLVMEHMSGWEFLDNLKNLSSTKKMPDVYVLSAFSNSKDRAIAKKHKVIKGYIDKPLSKNSLDKIFKPEVNI